MSNDLSYNSSEENSALSIVDTEKDNFTYEKYFHEMKERVDSLFQAELSDEKRVIKRLPLVKWIESKNLITILLLCLNSKAQEIAPFFREMIISLRSGNDKNLILSSRHISFRLLKEEESLYFEEILVSFAKESEKAPFLKALQTLAHEIKVGVSSKKQAQYLIGIRNLPLDDKVYPLFEKVFQAIRRYPNTFGEDLLTETHHILVHFRKNFRLLHEASHLFHITTTHYLFHKALEQEVKAYPGKRHLHFKLYKTKLIYPFGEKSILGITVVMNTLQEYEHFEPKHVLKVVQRIIPGLRAIPESFYSERKQENNFLTLYLEIEKMNEEPFTLKELIELKRHLKEELKNSIEYLTPSLFSPRNEEELYRNIIQLSSELKYVEDIPQAIISFHEQKREGLWFNVILLRLLSKKTKSIIEASYQLPPTERIHVEKVAQVGRLRKKYTKEATLFTLEIPSRHFLRKNHSVDLIRARSYVVKTIERLIGGPFRDYNGGFLLKQKEQLDDFKKSLGERAKSHELAIENLFFSLFPSVMQTILTVESGTLLFSLFLDTIEKEMAKDKGFLMLEKRDESSFGIAIKTEVAEIKERVQLAVNKLMIDPLKLASGNSHIEGYDYLTFLLLNPKEEEIQMVRSTLTHALQLWTKGQMDLQILRLHLPRAPVSLDPRVGVDRTSGHIIKMLYEGLMRLNREGKIEYALAKSVEISEDGKRYLFQLKKSLWSNGSPLTAYDFEYAWKKILASPASFPYAFLFFPILNAKAAKQGLVPVDKVGILALSDESLLIELEKPSPHFLGLLAHWSFSPLCQETDQKHPGWAYHSAETHVANGPFKLHEWRLTDDLELIKNPLYWDAASTKLDKISISIIEEDGVAFDLFQRGRLDWIGDPISKIPLKEITCLNTQKKLILSPLSGLFWLHLNTQFLPFKTAKLRRAFSLAISRKSIIEKTLKSKDEPALSFRLNGLAFTEKNDGDFELARQLFEEGLQELNLKKEELPSLLITHSDIEEHALISREVGRMWEKAFGLPISYERLSWHDYMETLRRQDYMVGGLAWYARYNDPAYHLDLLSCKEDATYVTNWENSSFNDLLTDAKMAEPEKKLEKIKAAESILCQEMPVIPLIFQHFRYAKNSRLQGIILSENGQIDFRETYLESRNSGESGDI